MRANGSISVHLCTTDFHGAARLHTKTVEEMSEAQDWSRKNGPNRKQW